MGIKHVDLHKLDSDSFLEFIVLDLSSVISDSLDDLLVPEYRLHPYNISQNESNALNLEDKRNGVLVWQGESYYSYPYQFEDIEMAADGSLPRPILKMSNIFPMIKDLTINLGDLINARIIRTKTFYKYLDYQETADPSQVFSEEIYVISRKKIEDQVMVQFELTTIIEANNIKLPKRQLYRDYCPWQYRGEGCGYDGISVHDKNNIEHVYEGSNGLLTIRYEDDNALIGIRLGDQNFNLIGTPGPGGMPKLPPGSVPQPIYGHAIKYADGNISLIEIWQKGKSYKKNDIAVYTLNGTKHYMLCIEDHVSSIYNRFSREYWIKDECAKSLRACASRRWSSNLLPFGGFPGGMRQ